MYGMYTENINLSGIANMDIFQYDQDSSPNESIPAPPEISTTKRIRLQLNLSISSYINHSYTSLIPYRNASMIKLSWEKFRNGTGKLIHFHARKAGGSTMKQWLRSKYMEPFETYFKIKGLAWNTTHKHYEMWTYAHPGTNLIDKVFKDNPDAVYVVHFREPVERIISEYQFEWRWGCQRCSWNSLPIAGPNKTDVNKRTFMRYDKYAKSPKEIQDSQKKYKLSATELDELLDDLEIYQNIHDKKISNKISFNAYVHNYYLWIFCCYSRDCNIEKDFALKGDDIIMECLNHTMKMLLSMNLVLVNEWFNDIRTMKYVDGMFFEGMDTEWFKKRPRGIQKRPNQNPRITNWGNNLMVTNETRQRLKEYNKYDIILYDFVKELAYDRQTKFFAHSI